MSASWWNQIRPPLGLGKSRAFCGSLLVAAALLFCGCQAKQPTLSPEAAHFKHDIKTCLDNLSATLREPVAQKDVAAINAALEKVESPAVKLCRLCPFRIGVLDKFGEALAVYPPQPNRYQGKNYSGYKLISEALKSKRIQQQRFYLQNGSELFIICAPLLQQDNVIGLVAIAVNSVEAAKKWGISDKQFLALDFNS